MTSATITSGTLTSPSISAATITGTTIVGQTIKTATSGARVELDASGVWQYNSGGTVVARIATDGTGYLGASNQVSWSSTTASMNADRLTTGTVGSGGSLALGSLSVSGTLTLGSGGKIIDADGSEWNQNGIILKGVANTAGDSITWKNSTGSTVGSIYPNGSAGLVIDSGNFATGAPSTWTGSAMRIIGNAANFYIGNTSGKVQADVPIYPGYTSVQGSYYIDAGGIISNGIGIGGMLGISSGNTINFISPTNGGSASNWSTFTVANIPDKSAGYFVIQIGGTNYRVPFYANG
jgi:hypothetical protein